MQAAIIHQYHFEEPSGATVIDSVGGLNGTPNGTTRISDGISGYAMHSFNTGNIVAFPGPVMNAGAKTIDFWYRAPPGSTPYILIQGTWQFMVYSNQYRVQFTTPGLMTTQVWTSVSPNDGNWHRLTCIYDPASVLDKLRLYVDGVQSKITYQWNGGERPGDFTGTSNLKGSAALYDIDELTIYDSVVEPVWSPTPVMTSISPSTVNVGGSDFTLTAIGGNFINGSVIRFDGVDLATTYVDSSHLTATVSAAQIASTGNHSITVFSAFPGGGLSSFATLSVVNPVPTISSTDPAYIINGSGAQSLIVNGTGFLPTSAASWSYQLRTTTYVSPTQINVDLNASDVATVGNYGLRVNNPTPGGGTSTAFTVPVQSPIPTLSSISPSFKYPGDAEFTLTVNGSSFINGSVVRFAGSDRATTFISSTQLTATIPATDLVAMGNYDITVYTPAPGGGSSGARTFTVGNPIPATTSISPTSTVYSPWFNADFTLTVNGSGFVNGAVVRFNGSDRVTTYVSPTQLTATILAADENIPGTFDITVFNPAPGGGVSGAQPFVVNNPAPSLGYIAPTSKTAGAAQFTLAVYGDYFMPNSVVRLDGVDCATTYLAQDQLTAVIPASSLVTAKISTVTVYTPAPGGGLSSSVQFRINNPAPTATSISPTTKSVGDSSLTLTVNGTNFNSSSVVRVGGSSRATSYVSSTRLTATLLSSDLAAAGSLSVTVNNPTPGGGTSAVVTLQVVQALPMITGVSPSEFAVQSGDSVLNLTGTNFTTSTVVRWSGSDRVTAYTDSNHISAIIPASDLAQSASVPVTAFDTSPGGGSSTSTDVLVRYMTPTVSSLSPASAVAGGAGFFLDLTGSNFTTSTAVYWDGSPRTMVFQSTTGVRMQVTAEDISTGGTHAITAGNPAPAGISGSRSINVVNPVPVLSGLSSTSTFAGSGDLVVALSGSGFVASSTASLAGTAVATVFLNQNQLTATLPSALLTTAGNFSVIVTNPAPGGGVSGAETFSVLNPLPTVLSLSPDQTQTGTGTMQVILTGTNYVATSVAQWDGSALVTSYIDSTSLSATIPSSLTAIGGMHSIGVSSPSPGGGLSATVSFTVYDSVPTTTGLTPDHADVGMPGFTLTVNGSNFNASSIVSWNGSDRTTTYINDTQLGVDIPASDLTYGGTFPIVVNNPGPGGGLSNAQTFTVYNPIPGLTTVSPVSANQGAADLMVTITGTGFTSSTVMRWNGNDRTTVFASSTSLTATVTAADLSTAGNASIALSNPAPGGGISASIGFFVNAKPAQPTNISPAAAAYGTPLTPTLQASAFSDSDFGDSHASSVWEVTSVIGDYSSPVYATTTDGATVSVPVPPGILAKDSSYGWHVRYLDQAGASSPYSAETIFYTPARPNQPVNISPANGSSGVSLTPTLSASAFTDPDPANTHVAAYWELAMPPGDYSAPVFAVTSTSDLTSILVPVTLVQDATYGWHVRYVDSDGDFSQFSDQTLFSAGVTAAPVQSSGGSAPPPIPSPTVLGGSYVSSTVVRWTFRNFSPFVSSFNLTDDAGGLVSTTGTGLIGVDLYIDEVVSSPFGVCGRSLTALSPFGNSVAISFPCSGAFGQASSGGILPLQVVSSTEETMVFRWASSTADLNADTKLYGIRISDFSEWLKPAGLVKFSLASGPANACDSDFTLSATPVFMTKSDWGPCFTLVDTTTTKDVTVQLFSKGSLGDDPKLVSSFLATLLKGTPKLVASKKIVDISVTNGSTSRAPARIPFAQSFGAVVLLATLNGRTRRGLHEFLRSLKMRYLNRIWAYRRYIHNNFAKIYGALSIGLIGLSIIAFLAQNQIRSMTSTIEPVLSVVTYEITVANQGTRSARNVKLIDEFPPEGAYVAGSFAMDGVLLTSEADGDAGFVSASSATAAWLRFPAGESHILRIALAFDGIVDDFSNAAELSSDEMSASFKSTCGNGTKESKEIIVDGKKSVVGEVCDDGDLNGTPGHCSLSCKGLTPLCGNGIYEPVFVQYTNVGESCDDGADKNGKQYGFCKADCKGTYIPADFICGNGTVNSYFDQKKNAEVSEFCDEGGLNGTLGHCASDCRSILALCGNGTKDKNESCDDGILNGRPGKCSLNCKYIMWDCGNGETEKRFDDHGTNFGEVCDDADKNGTAFGYCDALCKGTYVPADFICGNGKVNAYTDHKQNKDISEACDDGELNGKPGQCASDCRSILPMCGNAKIEAKEKCDEGAANGKPGHCAADCSRVLGDCGNGINEPFIVETSSGKVNVGEVCDDGDPNPLEPHLYKDDVVYAKDGKNGKFYGYCDALCKGTYIPADFICGNGKVNSYTDYKQSKEISETCDDGERNGRPGFCSKDCKSILPMCGNAKIEAKEKCDEGAANGKPGHCAKDCSRVLGDCGNGINEPFIVEGEHGPVNIGETCDQGDPDPAKPHLYKDQTIYAKDGTNGEGYGYCKADCSGLDIPTTCGNFKVDGWTNLATGEIHEELCDNGAESVKDAKGNFGLNGRPGYCNNTCDGAVAECGNGVPETGEFCDEGDAKGIHRIGGVLADTSAGKNGQAGHCSNDCKRIMEDCGNKIYEPYFVETKEGKVNIAESCDDGDPDPARPHLYNGQTVFAADGMNGKLYGYCAADCKGPYVPADFICGNDAVNSYTDYKQDKVMSEACDDGKLNGKPGQCSQSCKGILAMCGNGKVEDDEVCDSGPESDLDVGICKPDCSGYLDEAYLLMLKTRVKLSKRYVISILPIDENASSTLPEAVNASSSQNIISADELPPDPNNPLEETYAVVDDKIFKLDRDASGNIILPPELLKLSGKEFVILRGRDLYPGENKSTTSTSPISSSTTTVEPTGTGAASAGVAAGTLAGLSGAYSAVGEALSGAYSALRGAVSQPTADVGTALAAIVTLAALGAAVGPSLWTLLLMFLTQPLQLLGHRKPGAYGLVLNSLTQLPEPFAIVRLKSFLDQKILQTRVTDRYGRYMFLAQAGSYALDVTKKGFTYPTRFFHPGDKDAEDQVLLVDPRIERNESGSIIRHVPIDPIEVAGKPRSLSQHVLMAELRTAFAGLGPVISLVMAVLRPSASTLSLLAVQVLLFAFFWIVARPQLPRSFATVKDQFGKPLTMAVVRLFSKRFNKLVDTQVTDRSGHYAFLAGPGEYLLSVEKPGYAKTVVEVSKKPGEKTVTAQDIGLAPQPPEPPTVAPAA
ncbi:MAG: carboxypeptidase regulatory-like domain-containing protein [Patescibacteria group bacterium]